MSGTFGTGASGGSPPTAEIIITRKNGDKFTVLVDAADYVAVVTAGSWSVIFPGGQTLYVQRRVHSLTTKTGWTSQLLHRFLLNPPDGVEVDHLNGSGLDNSRSNLRLATRKENGENVLRRSGSSGFRGVSWDQLRQKWRGEVKTRVNGKVVTWVKRFISLHEAARETQAARLRLFTHTNEDRHPVPTENTS